MSKIILGNSKGGAVSIDLDLLLAGRALVTSNSGGGKSWLLRLMAERIYGKVPIWIVDAEGEFSSLRENGKRDFFIVGKGGDVPADPRYVPILVHKLLELRANVIFDIFELKPEARQHFVRALLDAMVDAPKHLWQALILLLDEAHIFAPESGKAEAYGAVVDMATRGRKRGFCLVAYTQRLAGLSKNVTTQLLNRLVGPTFEDVDLDRAADLLSIMRADRPKFFEEMRILEPGNFHGVGRAFGKHRILFKVGKVESYHPEVGKAKYATAPPPAPDKIKALLPKLVDIPKEQEKKAQTEKELRDEIRSYRAQLAVRPKDRETVIKTQIERIEVPIIKDGQMERLEKIVARLHEDKAKLESLTAEIVGAVADARKIEERSEGWIKGFNAGIPTAAPAAGNQLRTIEPRFSSKGVSFRALKLRTDVKLPEGTKVPKHAEPWVPPAGGQGITPAQFRILGALSDFEVIGRPEISRNWVAARAGASHKSSSFANNLGALRTSGLIEYRLNGAIALTPAGRAAGPTSVTPLNTDEMLASCIRILTPAQAKILQALHEVHPQAIGREDLAAKAGSSATSSSFANNLGALRSAGMIEYTADKSVKASDWLFVDAG